MYVLNSFKLQYQWLDFKQIQQESIHFTCLIDVNIVDRKYTRLMNDRSECVLLRAQLTTLPVTGRALWRERSSDRITLIRESDSRVLFGTMKFHSHAGYLSKTSSRFEVGVDLLLTDHVSCAPHAKTDYFYACHLRKLILQNTLLYQAINLSGLQTGLT